MYMYLLVDSEMKDTALCGPLAMAQLRTNIIRKTCEIIMIKAQICKCFYMQTGLVSHIVT